MKKGWTHPCKLPPCGPHSKSGGQQSRLLNRQWVVNQCGGRSIAVEVGKWVLLVPAHTVLTFM